MRKAIAAKFHDIISILNALLWITLAVMTWVSVSFGSVSWTPNLLMELLFFLVGMFFYTRANYLQRLALVQQKNGKLNKYLLKYLYLDNVFVFLSLIMVIVLNTAAASRVLGERLPIFG